MDQETEFRLRSYAHRQTLCEHAQETPGVIPGAMFRTRLELAICARCRQVFWRCPHCGDNTCLVCAPPELQPALLSISPSP